jgi:4-amino-4-deoxy-L-arabinose transferase-like glycosyltransferase
MPHWVAKFRKSLQPYMQWMALGWILAIALVTLFWGIGDIGLIDETEPLFVEASRQMLVTGDWITPYFDGETRFDKPPLIYWLMVLSFKIFGVSEWAARVPSALAALGTVVLCFYVLRQHSPSLKPAAAAQQPQPHRSNLAAWLGATMLMLNLNTYFWGRTGYADMLLMACMGGSLLAFFMGYTQVDSPQTQRRWYGTFYVLTALAVLTKGPIAIILPAVIIGGFALYLGNLGKVIREMQLGRGILLILVLALPWYILVTLANGDAFVGSFFGYHNLTRFSSVVNQHSGPWYFHFLVILAGFLPWSAYLPVALYQTQPWQRKMWQGRSRSAQLGLYTAIWFVVILGFFTVSVTKYFSYTLPLMPAAAILVSLLWTDAILERPTLEQSTHTPQRGDLSRWFNVVLMAGLSWALFSCAPWLTQDPWMPTLGEKIADANIPLYGGVLWAVAAVAAVLCILWRSNGLWLVNAIAFLLFITVVLHPAVAIVDQARQFPLRELAKAAVIAQQASIQKPSIQQPIIMIGFRKPSLVYYTQQHVEYIELPSQLASHLKKLPHPDPLVITTPKLLAETGLKPQQYQTLAQSDVYVLVNLLP